jgi:transcriptional regulator with XRE-family HTH domain
MTTEEDQHAQRLGYWLRRVREQRGITLGSAAMAVGLKPTSGSTVSLWERGQRPLKVQQLRRLAHYYGVPESFFMHPPKTDDERLAEALADAATLERRDWDSEGGGGPGDEGGPFSEPHRFH